MTRRRHLLLLTLAATVLAPSPALAARPGDAAAKDCTSNGRLTGRYTPAQLQDALDHLPSDALQYTNCAQIIRRAQLAAAGGGGSGSGGGSGTGGTGTAGGSGGTGGGSTGGGAPADPAAAAPPPADADAALQAATPQQRAEVTRARTSGAAPVQVDGARVSPSALDSGRLEDLTTLPTPVIVALVLLGLGTAAGGGAFAQHALARRRPL